VQIYTLHFFRPGHTPAGRLGTELCAQYGGGRCRLTGVQPLLDTAQRQRRQCLELGPFQRFEQVCSTSCMMIATPTDAPSRTNTRHARDTSPRLTDVLSHLGIVHTLHKQTAQVLFNRLGLSGGKSRNPAEPAHRGSRKSSSFVPCKTLINKKPLPAGRACVTVVETINRNLAGAGQLPRASLIALFNLPEL